MEAEGVLNPAALRGPDGQLCLFLRIVARGNYSRRGSHFECIESALVGRDVG